MKNNISLYFLLFTGFFMLISASGSAQEQSEFQKKQFIQENDTLNYRILFPKNFSEEKEYPLVLFLHGAG